MEAVWSDLGVYTLLKGNEGEFRNFTLLNYALLVELTITLLLVVLTIIGVVEIKEK